MGQGSQTGLDGQHPAWAQMGQMGGVASPLQMLQAQQQFHDQRNDFRSLPRNERREARPDFLAARNQWQAMRDGPQLPDPMERARDHFRAAKEQRGPEFGMIRDWYRGLQDMPPGEAIGTAAMGPPRMNEGPQFAPMMEVPQFPGMEQHDGTVQGLLSILQKQTANQTFGGGGNRGDGGPRMVETPDGVMAPEDWQDKWKREPGWSGNPNVSGR